MPAFQFEEENKRVRSDAYNTDQNARECKKTCLDVSDMADLECKSVPTKFLQVCERNPTNFSSKEFVCLEVFVRKETKYFKAIYGVSNSLQCFKKGNISLERNTSSL